MYWRLSTGAEDVGEAPLPQPAVAAYAAGMCNGSTLVAAAGCVRGKEISGGNWLAVIERGNVLHPETIESSAGLNPPIWTPPDSRC